nr:MAG TPA: hypothetical protein [Caudoviricetes sp.]
MFHHLSSFHFLSVPFRHDINQKKVITHIFSGASNPFALF